MRQETQQKVKTPILAYAGYLFQTFLKRPFGYIVAILYLVYLAVILVIVPSSLHFEPLFIWNIGGFNMPIFNLFFIAASAASIAVAVFRTGRDDGSDLTISAKPLTKGMTVWIKTAVYLIIMAVISSISLIIVAIIWPIFGPYNELTNVTGITWARYQALLLSVFIGNLINMLFFGGISVFISMIGGQVMTIVLTVVIVFVMCLMNFIFPQVTKSALEVLSDKYDTEIISTSCNTLHQYKTGENAGEQLNFATIQCITDEQGEESIHFDTKEYWDKANREAGRKRVNYIDFGKQLSSLYSSFGLEKSRLQEASKLFIGGNNSYDYLIDKDTHITEQVDEENYPISYYDVVNEKGMEFTTEYVVGSDMSLTTSNWYLLSTIYQLNFNSIVVGSEDEKSIVISDQLRNHYERVWNKMDALLLNDVVTEAKAREAYESALEAYTDDFSETSRTAIINSLGSDVWNAMSSNEKFIAVGQYLLAWSTFAQEAQNQWIGAHCIADFPFNSKQVMSWYKDKLLTDEQQQKQHKFNKCIFDLGIHVETIVTDEVESYAKLVTTKMSYAETLANMYQYTLRSFYKITDIIAIWSVISCCLFAGSIIVYKRTDFK
ncbi:MAG: hypothetical protein ACOQNY_00055 [Mycoplasmoidaceae bacterium]